MHYDEIFDQDPYFASALSRWRRRWPFRAFLSADAWV